MQWTLEQRRAACHPISDRFARRQGRQPFTTGEKQPLQLRKRVWCVHYMRGGRGGAYAPPLPNLQTGMPSFRALSAKFS